MPAIDDKDAAGNPQPKQRSDKRSKQEIVEEVRIDRQDVNWSEGGIPDFIGRLPLRISQGGNANDLSVQINVAMLPPVEDFRGVRGRGARCRPIHHEGGRRAAAPSLCY